jgi:hypothetical protein
LRSRYHQLSDDKIQQRPNHLEEKSSLRTGIPGRTAASTSQLWIPLFSSLLLMPGRTQNGFLLEGIRKYHQDSMKTIRRITLKSTMMILNLRPVTGELKNSHHYRASLTRELKTTSMLRFNIHSQFLRALLSSQQMAIKVKTAKILTKVCHKTLTK